MLKPDHLKRGSRNLPELLVTWDLGDSSRGCNLPRRWQQTKVSICCMCFCRCQMDCLFLANVNQLTKLPLFLAAAQIILGFFCCLLFPFSLVCQGYECVAFFTTFSNISLWYAECLLFLSPVVSCCIYYSVHNIFQKYFVSCFN